jgi:hypothetical protein
MAVGQRVLLKIGEHALHAGIENEETFASLQTGRTLRHVQVGFDVQGSTRNDSIVEGINREKRITLDDGTTGTFERSQNSWSFEDGDDLYHHGIELREVEDVKPTSVELLGLDLVPYKYEERVDDGGIVIEMKVRVPRSENDLLEERILAGSFFPVIRHGVEEQPREMRFGKCIWSEDGDHIKQILFLVEKVVHETDPGQDLFWPEGPRTRGMTAETREMMEALLVLLAERNVLSDDDIAGIRKRAEAGMPKRARRLYRVDDIDEEP